jgi:hypothetical protein
MRGPTGTTKAAPSAVRMKRGQLQAEGIRKPPIVQCSSAVIRLRLASGSGFGWLKEGLGLLS